MSTPTRRERPLKVEATFFLGLGAFFLLVGVIYTVVSKFEPVGSVTLLLLVGLCAITGTYLVRVGNEVDDRPEDDPNGEVDQMAGDYGRFSPWSWWPLAAGAAVTVMFLGPALRQWWVTGIGALFGIIAVVGHVFEYHRGDHGH